VLGPPPFDPATCTRTFTVAVADVGQITWMPHVVAAMQRELPRAQIRIVGIASLVALGDLGSTEVDLHLGVPHDSPGLRSAPLAEDRTVLVARRGHPALARGRFSRSALAELRHVRVELVPGKRFRDPFERLFARAKLARFVAAIAPSFTTAAELVARTDLVTMLPQSLLAAKATALRLVAPATPLPVHAVGFAMSWHDRTDQDPAARAFRALVQAAIRKLE
jgi:DNA-binding transcriptional LysR family regulator